MSHLKREQRPDKNGKMVTRIVLADNSSQTAGAAIPAPSVQAAPVAPETKEISQRIAYHFLKDAGYSREDYSQRHFLIYKKLTKLPSDVLSAAESVLDNDEMKGVGTKYLYPALEKGMLAEATDIVSTVVVPNLSELKPGLHGITGALRAIPDSCAREGYAMREGKELSTLAFLQLECALDRNDIFGKCDEIKDYVIENPEAADRVVRAIDERKTVDMEIILPMVEARALSEGVL